MAHKLLLADDSITIQKVVELVLAEEDFEIKSVNNGEDAFALISEFRPDIVLADIDMPRMNGYQLCEKIKQNPASSHIPVILLAGAFEPIDEELARHVRADDSVIKPFESQELISKINAVLAMGSAEGIEAEAVEAEEAEEAEIVEEALEEPAAVAEEDLWSMEEIPETTEEFIPETDISQETPEEVAAEAAIFEEAFPSEGEELAVAEEAVFAEEEIPAAEEEMAVAEEEFVFAEEEPVSPAAVQEPPAAPAPPRKAPAGIEQAPAVPSQDILVAEFRRIADERIAAFLSTIDLREVLLTHLKPSLKDSIEKVLWEVAPELTEKVLKEIIQGSVGSLQTQVEKVLWETVPDLAGTMIAKEIERIKAES